MSKCMNNRELIEIENNTLYFDGCDMTALAREYGTPVYVMSQTDIESRFQELNQDFVEKYPGNRVAYAAKAFCAVGMLQIAEKCGAAIDIVSGGELYVAKQAGFPAERIEFNGNNKQPEEIDAAVEYGVGRIILDGLQEVPLIEAACQKYQKKMKIMIRITPGVAASTHDYIVTGKKDSKFGIPLEESVFLPVVESIVNSKWLELYGLHMHIGSQLFENKAYVDALDALMDWAAIIKDKFGVAIREVNFGGGFGVTYTDEVRKPYAFFTEPLMEELQKRAAEIGIPRPAAVVEPGRSIVAEAGMTLYKVGQIKDIPGVRKYVSIDGGMGDNIRVALYQAKYDAIVANRAEEECDDKVTVCGKYCESGDILLTDYMLPSTVQSGDIIAMLSTGAYGYSMAMNYNLNTKPGVVLIKEGKAQWMVKPETYADMCKGMVQVEL